MFKVITFANQKGGVGKTTTAHIVAVGLAKKGYKVLSCDLDPQANLSCVFGINADDNNLVSIFDVFEGNCTISDAIIHTNENVDLLVGSLLLSGADRRYSSIGDEYKLKEALESVKDKYDFVILDTPPALGVMSLNALAATDFLVVPMTPDYFANRGLAQFQQTVESVKKYLSNATLKVNGLLLTRCDHTNLTALITEDMIETANALGTKIFNAKIRQAVAIRESQYLENSIFDIAKNGVLDDYNSFIDELLEEVKNND